MMTLYRGSVCDEIPVGVYWTPDDMAARHYAEQPYLNGKGVIHRANLSLRGLSCVVLAYEFCDSVTFRDVEAELELDGLSPVEQRGVLVDEGYDSDIILMADDYTGQGHYSHATAMVVTDRAVRKLFVERN